MAAPAFVSATAHAGNPTTAPSVTLPTTAADDILILVAVNGGAATAMTPAGTYSGGAWTLIDGGTWATGWGGVFWSRCTGNHSGQTVTGVATDSGSMLVVRVSGCHTSGSPVHGQPKGASVAALNGTLAATSSTVADTLVVLTAATDDNQTKSNFTKNGVAMSNLSLATSTGGADSGVGYANSVQAAAGSTGTFAITEAAGTAEGKRLSAFILKPPQAQVVALTSAAETDTAGTLVASKRRAVTTTTTTETAQALVFTKPIRKTLTPAAETDTAQAVSFTQGAPQNVSVTPATEADTAVAVTARKRPPLVAAAETDASQALVFTKAILKTLTAAAEADSAQPVTVRKRPSLTPATEVDTALARTVSKRLDLAPATEVDAAQLLAQSKRATLTPAVEADAAGTITLAKLLGVTPAAEVDVAQQLDVVHPIHVTLTPATEADAAGTITLAKLLMLTAATEVDVAQQLGIAGPIHVTLTPATEADAALALSVVGGAPDVASTPVAPRLLLTPGGGGIAGEVVTLIVD